MSCFDVPRETALCARFEGTRRAFEVLLFHGSLLGLLQGDRRVISSIPFEF